MKMFTLYGFLIYIYYYYLFVQINGKQCRLKGPGLVPGICLTVSQY